MHTESQKNKLQYFKNKVCTVFVPSINRNFDEHTNIEYFVGLITDIDDFGVWIQSLKNKKMNFINFKFVVGIAEEIVKDN
jgi:hypothetical protein